MKTIAASGPDSLQVALDVLRSGGLVCYPTDTVYGLGAGANDDSAVRRLYSVKERPADKPLPLLLADVEQVQTVAADVTPQARALMASFWPGALTIVLRRQSDYHSLALAGDTVALRVPDQPLIREIIRQLGAPLTGTSANRSGGASPLTAGEVVRQLGDEIDLLIDGGTCPGGIESTVVDATAGAPKLLREGALPWERIAAVAAQVGRR